MLWLEINFDAMIRKDFKSNSISQNQFVW